MKYIRILIIYDIYEYSYNSVVTNREIYLCKKQESLYRKKIFFILGKIFQ